jgi:hypothetical protein
MAPEVGNADDEADDRGQDQFGPVGDLEARMDGGEPARQVRLPRHGQAGLPRPAISASSAPSTASGAPALINQRPVRSASLRLS